MSREEMPIMSSKYLKSIPWEMIAPHERQAMKNHGQSLDRLASRGGLAPSEVLAIMDGVHWGAYRACDENDALLSIRADKFKSKS